MLCFLVYLIGNFPWIALASVVKSGLGSGLPEGANAHLVQAEEALKMGDWYSFAKEYHWIVHFMSLGEGGGALEAALKRQRQNALRKISTLPTLDTYTLDLSWLDHFTECQEEYKLILEDIKTKVETAEHVTTDFLLHALGPTSRQCTDVRPNEDKLLRITRELGDALLAITDQPTLKRARSNLEGILKEAVQQYPSLGKSPIYSIVLSKLARLRGDELEAVKIVWEALKVNKQNVHLMNQLAENFADPSKFSYAEVIKVELSKLRLDAICDCDWLRKFLGFDSWQEAFIAARKVIASCECEHGGLMEEVETLLMAFFKVGAFRFDIADSILSKVPRQSKASALLASVKNFKEGLVRLVNGTVNTVLLKDSNRSLEFVRNAVKISLDAAYVKKAEQIKESNERREKAEKRRLEEETERGERRQKWEEEVRRAQQNGVQRDLELDTKFHVYGTGFVTRDVEKAQRALSELNNYLSRGDFYNACPSYYEFDWDGDYTEVRGKQVDIKDALDKLGPTLDRSVLCYCESNEYAKAAYGRLVREQKLVERLLQPRHQQGIEEEKLLKELADPNLEDIRNRCDKFKDIARLLAKALMWNRAISALYAHCKSPTSDDYGDLLGAFSLGLQAGPIPGQISEVHGMLEFIKSHMTSTFDANSQWGKSLKWRAGLLSIREIFTKYANKSRVPVKPLTEAKLEWPSLGMRLESTNRSELVNALESSRSTKWVQLLPLIEEFFRLRSQELRQQRNAWEDRTYILFKYYTRAKDAYWSFTMLEEAFRCRTSPEEHKSLLRDRVKVEADIFMGIREWQMVDPQCLRLTALIKGYIRSLGMKTEPLESSHKTTFKKLPNSHAQSVGKHSTSDSEKGKASGSGSPTIKGDRFARSNDRHMIDKARQEKETRVAQAQTKRNRTITSTILSGKTRKELKARTLSVEEESAGRQKSSAKEILTKYRRDTEATPRSSSQVELEAKHRGQERTHKVKASLRARESSEFAHVKGDTHFLLNLYRVLLKMSSPERTMLYEGSDSENSYLALLHQGY